MVVREEKVDGGDIWGFRGKYKVWDMYCVIEGEGLMVIGEWVKFSILDFGGLIIWIWVILGIIL